MCMYMYLYCLSCSVFSVAAFSVYIQVTVVDHVDEVSMILLCHESSFSSLCVEGRNGGKVESRGHMREIVINYM